MNEQSTANNFENDKDIFNTERSDYKKLISRLQDIRANITLLEKIIFK